MSFDQLPTIIVTAVVSVIAKEVVVWLVGVMKSAAAFGAVKAIFNWTNLAIVGELLALAFYVYLIVRTGWTDDPVTGKDVLVMAGSAIGALIFIGNLLVRLAKASIARERAKLAPNAPKI